MSQAPRTKGERTRARVLDSATELFSRSGYNSVSLREIAAHAGLTHAGLLHHFPGKEQLLLEVLSRRDEVDAASLFPGLLGGDPAPALAAAGPCAAERLNRLVAVVGRNSRTPGLVALYAKLSAEASEPGHPARAYFVKRYRLLRAEIGALLGELFESAEPPVTADPDAVAQQLLALMDGLQTQWLLEPAAVPMEGRVWEFLGNHGLHRP
ncbi:TetR/AcrR family transcriptional regulator [Streptomyces sp. b94]|uniref:TetR/AcrR family transcriptional regulator n=1 Tax=Streptomyces sp. b94 TaxID=1827634 RepID=UPI001B3977A5|nr:TetR/AcrR family transcriptional regulator [Streptomyces sp. b94]MBQ1095415.1 TetR/AcrR family transcriptional regulator [Streptomyces sp. b94]